MSNQIIKEDNTYINISIHNSLIYLPISIEGSGDIIYASRAGSLIVLGFINISKSNILEVTSGVIIEILNYFNINFSYNK